MIAIYARQSIDKKDSISIESQIDFCKREIYEEEFKVYKDKGFSGKNLDRPAFKKLMQDLEQGIISKVIVYKLDRISRSILDFNKLMEVFKKNKVEFISVTEKFDTSTAMGRAMLNIIITFAQLEREQIAQRVKDNYYARHKEGRFLGGKVPFGFNKEKVDIKGKKVPILTPNLEEQEIIKEIYVLYATTNNTLGDIAKHLNKKEIKTANDKNWDSDKISKLMKSSLYVKADINIHDYYKNLGVKINNEPTEFNGVNGVFVVGKRDRNQRRYTDLTDHELNLGMHEGFIESDVFLMCQNKLEKNVQLKNSGKGKHTWLTGLTKCGYCGYSMSVVKSNSGKYLNCRGKTNMHICNGHDRAIHCEDIEYIVTKQILVKLNNLNNVKINLDTKTNNEKQNFQNKIKTIEAQQEKIVDMMIESSSIATKHLEIKLEDLEKEKNELQKKLNTIVLNEKSSAKDFKFVLDKVKNFEQLNFEDKRDVAKAMIEKILITDSEVKIEWKL